MAEAESAAARLVHLEADNARLRRLLDGAGLPDGLRHGLRDTLAMLRAILRLSAESAEDVPGYVAHLEGRLDAIARVRAAVDAFGEADLHGLISDELLFHLVHEGERAVIGGPSLRLRPKSAQVMALAMHELASNAVEHGILGEPRGRVAVSWALEPAGIESTSGQVTGTVQLSWKEVGGSNLAAPGRRGFGTRVLGDMLAYELAARADLAFEPDGLRFTVRFPLTARIGRIALEPPEEDEGSS